MYISWDGGTWLNSSFRLKRLLLQSDRMEMISYESPLLQLPFPKQNSTVTQQISEIDSDKVQ